MDHHTGSTHRPPIPTRSPNPGRGHHMPIRLDRHHWRARSPSTPPRQTTPAHEAPRITPGPRDHTPPRGPHTTKSIRTALVARTPPPDQQTSPHLNPPAPPPSPRHQARTLCVRPTGPHSGHHLATTSTADPVHQPNIPVQTLRATFRPSPSTTRPDPDIHPTRTNTGRAERTDDLKYHLRRALHGTTLGPTPH